MHTSPIGGHVSSVYRPGPHRHEHAQDVLELVRSSMSDVLGDSALPGGGGTSMTQGRVKKNVPVQIKQFYQILLDKSTAFNPADLRNLLYIYVSLRLFSEISRAFLVLQQTRTFYS
jgi:hypothetical protein